MSKLERVYIAILFLGVILYGAGVLKFVNAQTSIKGGLYGTAAQRPSTCSTGDIYIETDATSGQRLRVCSATDTWNQIGVTASGTGSCTNQAVTALNAVAAPTCTTLTSAYVNNSIALTGTDVNTSNQVTVTHLAAALPIAQGGTGNTVGIASAKSFGTTSAPACTNGGTTTFLGAGGGVASTTEASVVRFVAPLATTLKTMYVKIGGNVPSGETAAFKVSVNGSTTSTPNCSVAAAASTCNDTSTTKTLAAGDLVDISLACSGGTTALTASVSVTIMAQ